MNEKLIRSKRRTLGLQIAADATLIIRAPEKLSEKIIREFVEAKRGWIEKKQEQARASYRPPIKRDKKEVFWCRQSAYEAILPRVRHFSQLTGLQPSDIKITGAKTRWGSCSPSGTISFSWHLALSPPEVIDYVVVHELVHLEVKNHSRHFWRAVGRILPGYEDSRRWLTRNGHELML